MRTSRTKFRDAFRGVAVGLRGQSSFFAHVVAALLVIAAAAFFRVSALEWAILVLCIGVVFVAELANTSIEWLAKAITEDQDDRIRKALDVASAAVLLTALGAVVVGAIVFLPRLVSWLH